MTPICAWCRRTEDEAKAHIAAGGAACASACHEFDGDEPRRRMPISEREHVDAEDREASMWREHWASKERDPG